MHLRVTVLKSKLANEPLLVAMTDALQNDAGASVTDAADAPLLELSGESISSQVQTVSRSGRARGYTLKYAVSFRLLGPSGDELLKQQHVRLLRDYSFDPVNVLAKEREEEELRRNMRREAVLQILRRLASSTIGKEGKES